MPSPAFDSLAELYDLFQDWERRLPREIGWLVPLLRAHGVETVLDAACGTGAHLEALRAEGFRVAGSDIAPEMIARARARLGADPDLAVASFADAPEHLKARDAVIVPGNSLPNAGTEEESRRSVRSLARLVRPGGLLVLHLLNFPRLVAAGGGLSPVRRVVAEGRQHLFVKLFEVHRDRVVLDVIALVGDGDDWDRHLMRSELWPMSPRWLESEVVAAGLKDLRMTEGFSEVPFSPADSGDLVLTARRPG